MKNQYLMDAAIAFGAGGTTDLLSDSTNPILPVIVSLLAPLLKECVMWAIVKIRKSYTKKDIDNVQKTPINNSTDSNKQ